MAELTDQEKTQLAALLQKYGERTVLLTISDHVTSGADSVLSGKDKDDKAHFIAQVQKSNARDLRNLAMGIR